MPGIAALAISAVSACGRPPQAPDRAAAPGSRRPVSEWFVVDAKENVAIEGQRVFGLGFDGLPPQPIERRPLELPAGSNPEGQPVIVETVIGPSGRIARARLVKGPRGPEVERAVVQALQGWSFEPALDREAGHAVAVRFVVTPALASPAPR